MIRANGLRDACLSRVVPRAGMNFIAACGDARRLIRNTIMQRKPIAALLLSSLPVLGQTQTASDAIVVTATRTPQPAESTLGQTIVITRADIESAGPVDLAQLLRIHANADVRTTGGPGQPASLFLRGTNGNHTLFLIDGLRVNSASLGSTSIETIPLDLIERIEIVKGPFSGLYGSDAMGGVVQIFTRDDAKPLLRATLGVGNRNAMNANAGVAATEGDTHFTLNAGHSRIRAESATNPRATFSYNEDRDPHRVDHVNAKISRTFRNGETLTLSAFQSSGRTDFDGGATTSNSNRQKISGYQLESRNELSPGWQSRLVVGRGTDDLRYEGGFTAKFKTEQDQVYWTNELKTDRGFMTVGADARVEKVSGSSPFEIARRETKSVFAGYLERMGSSQLEFNLRRDEEEQFGSRNTGSVSYGLKLSTELQLYAKGGRAFRAPSFSDLYLPPDPDFGPSSNPLLRPEKSDAAEIGLKYRTPQFMVSLVGFNQKIDDLITFVFGSGPQNVRRARIRGVELQGGTRWFDTNMRMAVTAQRPEDEDTHKRLQGRAETLVTLNLDRTWGKWRAATTVTHTGERFDSTTEAPASRMSAYTLLDANLRYAIDKYWTIELAIANVTDKRYELAQGYNAPGRLFMLNLKFAAR